MAVWAAIGFLFISLILYCLPLVYIFKNYMDDCLRCNWIALDYSVTGVLFSVILFNIMYKKKYKSIIRDKKYNTKLQNILAIAFPIIGYIWLGLLAFS